MHKALTLTILLLILGAFSANHYKNPSHNEELPAEAPHISSVAPNSSPDQSQSKQKAPESQHKMEWLYEFIGWPEGTTALAIILTLGAIVWQSDEMRRAADATADAAKAAVDQAKIANATLIAQFRPKVIVRYITLERDDSGSWRVQLYVENIGGTKADIVRSEVVVQWQVLKECRYVILHSETIDGFSLDAGGEHIMSTQPIEEATFSGKLNLFDMAVSEGRPEKYSMYCAGVVRYTYETVAARKTSFVRKLRPETRRFGLCETEDDEYQD